MSLNFMETDTPDNCISDLKLAEDTETMRITFRWPQAIAQLYVFKISGDFDFDVKTADISSARLFTQQEYKRQGGFADKKTSGTHTYHFFPFIRENGEDTVVIPVNGGNKITCVTGQIPIYFMIKEKTALLSGEKTHTVSLSCERGADAGAVCYVKKEGGYPLNVNDGTVYFFGEALQPGRETTAQVKTKKNEFIRLFIYDKAFEDLYRLKMVGE